MYARKKMLKMKALIGLFFFLTFQINAQPPQISTNNAPLNGTFNQHIEVNMDSLQIREEINPSDDANEKLEIRNLEKDVNDYKTIRTKTKSNAYARSPSEGAQQLLDKNVQEIQSIAPESIEAEILYYDAGNYNADRASALQSSLEKDAENEEALTLWVANSLVLGDTIQAFATLKKMEALNYIPRDVLCYAKDLYASVPKNAILITHGKWDTYGFVYEQMYGSENQQSLNVSLDLLQSPQYRKLLTRKGLMLPEGKRIDVEYFKALCEINDERQFAFSMTIPKEYLVSFAKQMIPNGLVFLYPSSDEVDQVVANNEAYLDSFLFMDCGQMENNSLVGLNANYLPMLMLLEQQYENDKGSNVKLSQVQKHREKLKRRIDKSPK
jgi:hypothetical protein